MKNQSFASTKEYQSNKPASDEQTTPYVEADLDHLFNVKLSASAWRLFLILKHYGWETGQGFPDQEQLARDMGLQPRQIRNLLTEIETFEMGEKQARPEQHKGAVLKHIATLKTATDQNSPKMPYNPANAIEADYGKLPATPGEVEKAVQAYQEGFISARASAKRLGIGKTKAAKLLSEARRRGLI